MHTQRRIRVTYSGVTATLALVIALSTGGAYAAGLIHTNQIANGAITAPKLAANSVANAKIAAGAVGNGKIANGAVSTNKLDAATRSNIVPPWGTIPSGKMVSGTFANDTDANGHQIVEALTLPAAAPVQLTQGVLGFGAGSGYHGTVNPNCGGTPQAPTPSAGYFCVYLYNSSGIGTSPDLQAWDVLGTSRAVFMYTTPSASTGHEVYWWGVWAYRAP